MTNLRKGKLKVQKVQQMKLANRHIQGLNECVCMNSVSVLNVLQVALRLLNQSQLLL